MGSTVLAGARLLDDPNYCRLRAAAMRACFGSMTDEQSKAFVLMIAGEYEKLAQRAEKDVHVRELPECTSPLSH
jgi:hypothetical protein